MVLKFCKDCGCVFRIQKIDDKKSYMFCDKCQIFEVIKTGDSEGILFNEKIEKQDKKGEGVNNDENEFADYDHICKKCGYGKVQIIDVGVLYSDEDNLYFLKCGKCGFSERVGRKTT